MEKTILYLFLSVLIFPPFAIAQNDPNAFYNQGQAHAARGEYAEALVFYDKVLKLEPAHTDALHQKGVIHTFTGDTLKAIHCFNLVLMQDPAYAMAYHNRSDLYYRRGQLREAEADVSSYLRLEPRDARAYVVRATIRHKLGMVKEALADYDESIRLNPSSDTAYVSKALSVNYEYGSDKAFAILDECLRKMPRSEYALETRSQWYYAENRYADALKDISSLVNLANARQDNYRYNRALLLQTMGNLKGACQDLELLRSKGEILPESLNLCETCAGLVSSPGFLAECLVREGYTLLNKEAYARAYTAFNRAIEKSPENKLLYYHRAMVAFSQNRYEAALPDIKIALAQKPEGDRPVKLYALAEWAYGYSKMQLDEPETAREYYLKAMATDPSDARFYKSIGAMCLDLEEYPEGIAYLDKAIVLDPSDASIYLMRGEGFLLMKDKMAACESFRKAADLGDMRAFQKIMEACY